MLESKKEFANNYALDSQYWQHFAIEDRPEIRDYLKANIEDLANHYHALYQEETLADERPANYREASYWYGEFLSSFPQDTETAGIHYQFADLLLEHEDFGAAALAYESTAYEYAPHERAAEAEAQAAFRAGA